MRRCLIIFLLVFMPMKFSWAAVVAYCQHETGVSVQHVGHHEHQHVDRDGDASRVDFSKVGGTDPDCGTCHAGCAAALLGSAHLVHSFAAVTTLFVPARFMASLPSDRPERPQWLFLA
jgi:hypothetical protein